MEEVDSEFKLEFLSETLDLLNSAEEMILRLEADRKNKDILNMVFRLCHNLKGTSQAVGLEQIGELSHQMENLILLLKDEKIKVTNPVITTFLNFKEKILYMVTQLQDDLNKTFDISDILEEIDCHIKVRPINTTFSQKNEKEIPKENTITEESVRVPYSKLSELANFLEDLHHHHGIIQQNPVKSKLYESSINEITHLLKDAHDLLVSMKMLSFKKTFSKLSRIVEETAKRLGKEINFSMRGKDIQVTKNIIDKIGDPLMHILRNSIDHGIESVNVRKERQKTPEGNISIDAVHMRGNLVLTIKDDGGGIDPVTITKSAIEKDLISRDKVLTEEESLQLIFLAGFSTKELATEISGRGIGMDVVQSNIQELGGDIKINSVWKRGTEFVITIPQTQAVLEGVTFRAGNDYFVIPAFQVFEQIEIDRKKIEDVGNGKLLKLGQEIYPIFDFNSKLGIDCETSRFITVLIIEELNSSFAVIIQESLGKKKVELRHHAIAAPLISGIIGTAVVDNSKNSFVINIAEFFKNDLIQNFHYKNVEKIQSAKRKILLVDDDVEIVDLLKAIINVDYDCQVAGNGHDGLNFCSQEEFEFIVSDFQMPVMNGIEFIQNLRSKSGRNSKTPIIMLTGHRPDIDQNQKVWENVFFIEKPFNETQFNYIIKCCIQLKKLSAA